MALSPVTGVFVGDLVEKPHDDHGGRPCRDEATGRLEPPPELGQAARTLPRSLWRRRSCLDLGLPASRTGRGWSPLVWTHPALGIQMMANTDRGHATGHRPLLPEARKAEETRHGLVEPEEVTPCRSGPRVASRDREAGSAGIGGLGTASGVRASKQSRAGARENCEEGASACLRQGPGPGGHGPGRSLAGAGADLGRGPRGLTGPGPSSGGSG